MSLSIPIAGWTLMHFIWQGALLALAAATVLRLGRQLSPNVRYIVACSALGTMVLIPLVTAVVLSSGTDAGVAGMFSLPSATVSESAPTGPVFPLGEEEHASGRDFMQVVQRRVEGTLPFVVMAWLSGVVLLAVRTGGGWWRVRGLHRTALGLKASRWSVMAGRIAAALRVRTAIHVVDSALVDVPTAVGWLRPVILLPIAALANLTPAQVEAILVHELAHVRRHDYLVNLLQVLAETLLFYHPAVWWMSRCVRAEREHCCDDVAVEVSGDRVAYASALVELEAWRTKTATLALAATSGPLLCRVRRILRESDESGRRMSGAAIALAFTLVLTVGAGGFLPLLSAGTRANMSSLESVLAPSESVQPSDWQTGATDHFEIHYGHELDRDLFERVARHAEAAYEQVSASLEYDLSFKVPLVLFRGPRNSVPPEVMSYAASDRVAPGEIQRDKVVLPIGDATELYPLITHELTHVFAFEIIPRRFTSTMPLWVDEGLADYMAGEWSPSDVEQLHDLVASDRVPSMSAFRSIGELANERVIYVLGHSVFDFIEDRWGQEGVRLFMFALRSFPRDLTAAYDQVFAMTPDEFDQAFERYLKERFATGPKTEPAPRRGEAQRRDAILPDEGVARGRVVSAQSDRPIENASVSLVGPAGESAVSTDADGRYEARELEPGQYYVYARADGYVEWAYGQSLPREYFRNVEIRGGEVASTIDMHLPRAGSLAGRILDQAGDGFPGVEMELLTLFEYPSGLRPAPVAVAMTDESGLFQFGGLYPGEYYVKAYIAQASPEQSPRDATEVYAPTYFPSTTRIEEALPVWVSADQQLVGIDIGLEMVETLSVSGLVSDTTDGRLDQLLVNYHPTSTLASMQMAPVVSDGTFRVTGLIPGNYVLRVLDSSRPTAGLARPGVRVTVEADVSDVQLVVPRGARLEGRVVRDGVGVLPFDPSTVRLVLAIRPGNGGVLRAPGAIVEPDGRFAIADVFGPTTLEARELPPGWRVKSVRLNGADITHDAIEFGDGVTRGLQVVLTNQDQPRTRLSGVVSDGRGRRVSSHTVVVFPEDRARWAPSSRFVRMARTNQDGRYDVQDLPPTNYLAIAVPFLQQSSGIAASVLEQLYPRATAFSLEDGEVQTLDLRIRE